MVKHLDSLSWDGNQTTEAEQSKEMNARNKRIGAKDLKRTSQTRRIELSSADERRAADNGQSARWIGG